MPEKYLIPGSELSLHEESLSMETEGSAPRSGWKLTLQGPSIFATTISVVAGTVREVAVAGLRKTTNTLP